ncbi:MAG: AAA family ATPase, partial [Gammaproteobacteria bacterium]|nr:AAA family ATPase [Gammaproteobacteria bacterium]
LMMGSSFWDIAAIVPELAEEAEVAAPRVAESRDMMAQARFHSFDAIGRFFAKAAQQVPLVIIIDNLHWADEPSLSLLEFLSQTLRRSRVLMLGTYRDAEVSRKSPLLATLGELSRERGVERMRLGGLSAEAIGELARHMIGVSLTASIVEAIYEQTDGNPLFVIELLRVLT